MEEIRELEVPRSLADSQMADEKISGLCPLVPNIDYAGSSRIGKCTDEESG